MSIVIGAWTARTTPPVDAPTGFARNGTRVVSNTGIYTDDGVTWALGVTGLGALGAFGAGGITQGGGTFVRGGQNGDDPLEAIAYSTDGGVTWTRVALPSTLPAPVVLDVVYRAGYGFVGYEFGGVYAFFSATGVSWAESALTGAPTGVACPVAGASAFVAINGDLDGLLRSTDGLAWSAPSLPSFSGTPTFAYEPSSRAGVYADGTFAFLFTDGLGAGVLRSTDEGLTWTITRLSGVTAPQALSWNGDDDVYLLVEADRTAWATADFATLTAAPSPTIESAILWTGSLFVGGRTAGGPAVETATVTVTTAPPTPGGPPTTERRGNRWRLRGPWTIGTATYEFERKDGPSWTPIGDITPADPDDPGGDGFGPGGVPGDGDPTGESWTFTDRPPEWKTDYEYRYRECNAVGCSGWSPVAAGTARDGYARGTPQVWRTRDSRAAAPSLSTAPLVTLADDRLETLAGDLLETL